MKKQTSSSRSGHDATTRDVAAARDLLLWARTFGFALDMVEVGACKIHVIGDLRATAAPDPIIGKPAADAFAEAAGPDMMRRLKEIEDRAKDDPLKDEPDGPGEE